MGWQRWTRARSSGGASVLAGLGWKASPKGEREEGGTSRMAGVAIARRGTDANDTHDALPQMFIVEPARLRGRKGGGGRKAKGERQRRDEETEFRGDDQGRARGR